MTGAAPAVTIVVVPRERFSMALASLDSIYAFTDLPFHLVYVDGGSPWRVRRGLRRRAAAHGFELIRTRRYLTPTEARNMGLRRVRTPYVVFIDNDVVVTPGWLPALVRCADETGAAVCGPLQLIGPPEEERIHVAGGTARILEDAGRRYFQDTQRWSGRTISAVRHELVREPVELVEFHCLLARRDVLEGLGPLDERLLNNQEHTDLCLRVRDAGHAIVFEPASVVSYDTPTPLALSDLRYFFLRWSDDWTRRTHEHFAAKWRLDARRPGLDSAIAFSRWHRRLPTRQARARLERLLGRPIGAKGPLAPLERGATRLIVRWTELRRRRPGW